MPRLRGRPHGRVDEALALQKGPGKGLAHVLSRGAGTEPGVERTEKRRRQFVAGPVDLARDLLGRQRDSAWALTLCSDLRLQRRTNAATHPAANVWHEPLANGRQRSLDWCLHGLDPARPIPRLCATGGRPCRGQRGARVARMQVELTRRPAQRLNERDERLARTMRPFQVVLLERRVQGLEESPEPHVRWRETPPQRLVSRGPELRDQTSHVRVSGQLTYESHRIDIDGTQPSTHVPLCCPIHEVNAPVTGPTDDAWRGEWRRRRRLCAPRCRGRSLRPGVRCTPGARSGWSRLRHQRTHSRGVAAISTLDVAREPR